MYIIDHKIPKYLYKLRDKLLEEYLQWLSLNFNKITDHKRTLAKKAVSCMILNLNSCMLNHRDTMILTLRESSYSKTRIVNGKDMKRKVSYTYTRSLYNFLNISDYGDLTVGGEIQDYGFVNGVWQPTEYSTSYFKINYKLKSLYIKHVKVREKFDRIEDVMILRKSKSKLNEVFKMTDKIEPILDFVERWNQFSMDKNITLKGKRLDIQIYKIFNGDFDNGGRSHHNCNYQYVSKRERQNLEIEGSPVVCYDYKGFEPSIAYSMNQEIMDMNDPYHTESIIELGYDEVIARKLSKLTFIICLNVDSENSAKLAINKAIADNMDVSDLYSKGLIPTKTIPVKLLIEKVKEVHYIIEDLFFTAKGLMVQNIGAAINDYILDSMMQNHKQVVMQVHDDFSVAEEYENVLKDTMFRAYEYVLGFSDNCKIEKEY
jgi:hypothetical protein|tara:strand:- start:6618 stop:7910 length:1293 start_codon:yes stop_codon:yes gene_type:complete